MKNLIMVGACVFAFALSGQESPGNQEKHRHIERVTKPDQDFPQIHALLIGVQNYDDENLKLQYPLTDVKRLEAVLQKGYRFADVRTLPDPSRQELFKELEDYLSRPEGDSLLIFFAGHGYYDEVAKQGYWLPRDADKERRGNWVSNADIRDLIARLNWAQHILLISDACFSGSILKIHPVGTDDGPFSARDRLRSRTAITSNKGTVVLDKSDFIDHLVKHLEHNSDPVMAAKDLFLRVLRGISERTDDRRLIPRADYGTLAASGDEKGDFFFVRKDAKIEDLYGQGVVEAEPAEIDLVLDSLECLDQNEERGKKLPCDEIVVDVSWSGAASGQARHPEQRWWKLCSGETASTLPLSIIQTVVPPDEELTINFKVTEVDTQASDGSRRESDVLIDFPLRLKNREDGKLVVPEPTPRRIIDNTAYGQIPTLQLTLEEGQRSVVFESKYTNVHGPVHYRGRLTW